MEEDPDDTMALLADLTGTTDPVLRDLARRLAGRLFLDLAKRGPTRPRRDPACYHALAEASLCSREVVFRLGFGRFLKYEKIHPPYRVL